MAHLLQAEVRDGLSYRAIRWEAEFTSVQPARPRVARQTSSGLDGGSLAGNAPQSSRVDATLHIERSINSQKNTQFFSAPEFFDDVRPLSMPIDPEIDWITVEHEFMTQWNKTAGVAIRGKPVVPGNLQREFKRLWSDPEWRANAMKAIGKFPLRNGVIISLKKFLEESTVDDILGGVHDFSTDKKHEPGRTFGREKPLSAFERRMLENRAEAEALNSDAPPQPSPQKVRTVPTPSESDREQSEQEYWSESRKAFRDMIEKQRKGRQMSLPTPTVSAG